MKAFFKRFRRDIRELWDTIRVRVLTMGSLIVFLGICFYIFGRLVYSESHEQLGRTLESFAQKFSQTLEMLNLDLRHLDSAEHVKLRTLFPMETESRARSWIRWHPHPVDGGDSDSDSKIKKPKNEK